MDELLAEMRSDVMRLPNELSKIPAVSVQLKMDEISIISKLAKTPVSQSVITHAPSVISSAPHSSKIRAKSPRSVKKEGLDKPKQISQAKLTYAGSAPPGPQVQLPTGSSLAMQTPEGLVVYSVASNTPPPQSVSVVQAGAPGAASTVTTSAGQTIAIGVPTYLDSSSLYQLVPASGQQVGQQVVYWPPVVGTGQPPAQVTTVAAAGTGSQLAVVQKGTSAAVAPAAPTVLQFVDGKPAGSQKSVITID